MMSMIRFSERLEITEEQKTEITNSLGCFLKYVGSQFELDEIDNERILTWWLKYAKKPGWIKNKLQNDVEFIAQIHDFIGKHKTFAKQYQETGEIVFHPMREERRMLELFLSSVKNDKTNEQVDWEQVEKLSNEELKNEINKYFYLNNEFDTLAQNPLIMN